MPEQEPWHTKTLLPSPRHEALNPSSSLRKPQLKKSASSSERREVGEGTSVGTGMSCEEATRWKRTKRLASNGPLCRVLRPFGTARAPQAAPSVFVQERTLTSGSIRI